jgi:lauroyl/myristoyl acyltransferase
MSIGSFLTSKENLALVKRYSWSFGRPEIIKQGLRYFNDNPDEVDQIINNLNYMGFASAGRALDDVLEGIVIHYFEKLFSLVKTYEAFWICKNRVELGDTLDVFKEAASSNKAVFIAQSHFGATYFLAAVLMVNGFEVNTVGKFPEPVGSMLVKNSNVMTKRYGAARANIINIADSSVDVPMEMFRLLYLKKIVSNVFDENNRFSRPVKLLGKDLFGGSGMDLILKNLNDNKVILVTPFLVRTSDETFRYEIDRHYFSKGDIIESFYRSLEKRIKIYPEQWYFIRELHESMIDKSSDRTAGQAG